MERELISADEFADLPDENDAAFVAFESICRSRLHALLANLDQNESPDEYYLEYMGRVHAAAKDYEIEDLEKLALPKPSQFTYSDFKSFFQLVLGAVTRLQIRVSRRSKVETVLLQGADKLKILHHIQQLRTRIEQCTEIDEAKRRELLKKLDDLQTALNEKRLNLAKVAVVLAAIAATISQTESILIKAPETYSAIMQVIGFAQADQPSAKQLPTKKEPLSIESKVSPQKAGVSDEVTDEEDIPF